MCVCLDFEGFFGRGRGGLASVYWGLCVYMHACVFFGFVYVCMHEYICVVFCGGVV